MNNRSGHSCSALQYINMDEMVEEQEEQQVWEQLLWSAVHQHG